MVDEHHLIRSHMTSSLVDWPGHVTQVLFIAGCNVKCPTCHNKSLWTKEEVTLEQTFVHTSSIVQKLTPKLIPRITITGGEPLCYDQLIELCVLLKERGFIIKLDTNMCHDLDSIENQKLMHLIETGLIDVVAADIKAPFHLYPKFVGTKTFGEPNLICQQLIMQYIQEQVDVYFRTTRVPLLTPQNIESIEAFVPKGMSLIFNDFREPTI